ncbi:hypothetical protein [Marivirga sp.]|uniref:hypothetical protein n=1 Tax=Marivirga sp. TaxID=2018662 RepID=UPI003DA6F51B
MASNQEQRKIEIIANGSKFNASFKDMAASARILDNQLKKLPANSQEFVEKSKQLKDVRGRMKGVKDEMYGTQKATTDLTKSFAEIMPFGGQFQMIGNEIGKTGGFVSALSKRFGILKLAIASTGIGALLIVVGSLISYLTSTQEGMDKVTAVTRPLKAVFQTLIGVVQKLGKFIFDNLVKGWDLVSEAVSNPKKTLQDLLDFLKDQVMNRIKSFGVMFAGVKKLFSKDWKQGLKEMGDGFIQMQTGITNGTDKMKKAFDKVSSGAKSLGKEFAESVQSGIDAGTRLDQLTKQIEKTEIELTKSRAELNVQYNRSKELANDVSNSEEVRLENARKAAAAQNQLLAEEQSFLDLKIERMKLEHSLNDTSREDELELARLIAERTNFEAQAAKKRMSVRVLENSVLKSIETERKKENEAAIKREEERLAKIRASQEAYNQWDLEATQAVEDLKVSLMAEGANKEIAQLQLKQQRELQAIQNQKDEILNSEKLNQEQKQALIDQFNQQELLKQQEFEQQKNEVLSAQKEENLLAEIEEMERWEEQLNERDQEKFELSLEAEHEKNLIRLEQERLFTETRMQLLEEAGLTESDKYQQLQQNLLDIQKEKGAEEIRYEQEKAALRKQIAQETYGTIQMMSNLALDVIDNNLNKELSGIDRRIQALSEDENAREQNANKITQLEAQKVAKQKEAAEKQKRIQKGQIIIDGLKEIAGIWASYSSLGPAGVVLAGIQTGIAVGRTALAIDQVESQQFAKGGATTKLAMLGGTAVMPDGTLLNDIGSFAGGGMASNNFGVIGEAGPEWVGPNWMIKNPKYADTFRWLEGERIRKGRAFEDGGTTAGALSAARSNREQTTEQSTQGIQELRQEVQSLRTDMREYTQAVQSWATNLHVNYSASKANEAMEVLAEIEADSEISR